MCGIAGTTQPRPDLLGSFLNQLAHRGPDDRGIWFDDALGLAHTRLAIIDLSPGGHQPMLAGDRYVIVYNGEIFNYRDLRSDMEKAGERFRSDSDTEVLLALLRRDGDEGLKRVSGMFALALWDRVDRELLLARDRLGIKPLVYAELPDGGIAFASEIETLLMHPHVGRQVDPVSISEYLACLYVPGPRTIWRGIRKLLPGHALRWKAGRTAVSTWWSPSFGSRNRQTVAEAVEELCPLLRRAVAEHLVSDVSVGCFLSGGIDSSVIAALMAEQCARAGAPPISTYTMTFKEAAYDEREAARAVAVHIGSRHTELAATVAPSLDRLTPMLAAFGEPFGNPTALLIDELAKQARRHVSVALVGDGGDEIFAGYPRYSGGILAPRYKRLPTWLRRYVVEPVAAMIPESTSGWHWGRRIHEFVEGVYAAPATMYASWVEYFTPAERAELLGSGELPISPIEAFYRDAPSSAPLDAMQQTDLLSFLPGNLLAYGDAMSMAHALELRLPLLDYRVVEYVTGLPPEIRFAHGPKTLLRGVASRLLPRAIVGRRKRGFNPPMGRWLRKELATLVERTLSVARLEQIGINPRPVQRLLREHISGSRDNALKIWGLLVLERWMSLQGPQSG